MADHASSVQGRAGDRVMIFAGDYSKPEKAKAFTVTDNMVAGWPTVNEAREIAAYCYHKGFGAPGFWKVKSWK